MAKQLLLIPALFLTVAAPAAQAEVIGRTSAVNPAASGAPPGGSVKTLNVGENIVHKYRVTTTASGSVQLIFVDRSTFSIGPNSNLVIDEFVYDPKANVGKMSATLSKGVMRFVGGQASHTGGATISTPATTLGIRGGIVTVRHDGTEGTRVVNHFGRITVQTASGTEVIRRPGFAVSIASRSQPAPAPTRVTRTEVDSTNQTLTSKTGQTGGRRENPADSGQSQAVGGVNSGVSTVRIEGQRQTVAQAAQITTQPVSPQPVSTVVQTAATNATQETASVYTAPQTTTTTTTQPTTTTTTTAPTVVDPTPVPPPTPTPPAPVIAGQRYYTLATSQTIDSILPTAFATTGTWRQSGVVGYGVGGTNADGTPNTTTRAIASGIVINGAGASQTSTIYLATASFFPNDADEPGGGIFATTRRSATSSMGRLASAMTPIPATSTYDSVYVPQNLTVNQNEYTGAGLVNTSGYYPGGGGTSGGTNFNVNLTKTTNSPQLGTYRPEVQLVGSAAGLYRTNSLTNNVFNGPSHMLVGNVYIDLTSSSRFGATMAVGVIPSTSTRSPQDDLQAAVYLFGYQGAGSRTRSSYVDYNNFGARSASQNVAADTAYSTISYGTSGATTIARREWGLMTNTTDLGVNTFFPGVTFCNCEYTRWGFWSQDSRRTGTTSDGGVDPDVSDRVHMGTWVAGVPTAAANVPTVGTATFTGHAIGSFKSGSAEYIAAGNLSKTINFGSNSGTFAVSGLDGKNYTGTVVIPSTTRNYFGGTGAAGTTSMSLIGQFYNNSAGAAMESGGHFTVQGTGTTPYFGAGTFAARR